MLRLDTKLLKAEAAKKGDETHEEIARRAGIDRSAVTRLFLGTVPSLANITALAWAYDIPLDDLVPKSGEAVEVPA
ncbi:helix-turn-helix domain-containing protein [Streptomyces cellulosae]